MNQMNSLLSSMTNSIESEYLEFEKYFSDSLLTDVTLINSVVKYLTKRKGKRFRPILVHLAGRAGKIDLDVLMNISLAIELLHNFTLVHDDIMDNDTVRHGKMTIHEKWDSSTAILAGDGIYTLAQIILNDLPSNVSEVSRYFNSTTFNLSCIAYGKILKNFIFL